VATYDQIKKEVESIAPIVSKYSESVQGRVFELLIGEFIGIAASLNKKAKMPKRVAKLASGAKPNATKPRKKKVNESYKIDSSLNLRGGSGVPSFKDFFTEKSPTAAMEFNAVAAYYLIKHCKLKTASFNQLYTCYKEVKYKFPQYFRQSVIDTKNQKGWIDLDDQNGILLPHRGEAFVDDDLPHKSGI
jgi:hypothetical protein